MMKSNYFKFISAGAIGLSLMAAVPANADNTHYAPGDLVLAFQKKGSTNTVYVGLGNAATLFRGTATGPDAANRVEFLDVSATLVSAFGAGWATDPNIYAGVAGVFGNSGTSSVVTQGDPHRTLYISRSRDGVGTVGTENSSPWDLTLAGNTAMTSAATGIQQQNNAFDNNYTSAAVVSLTSISQIDEMNPLVTGGIPPITSQGPAMGGSLEGGIQQIGNAATFGTFGYAGSVEFALDLYRVLAKTGLAGQVGGSLRVGSYEGTVTVGTNGKISFLTVPTGYDTWVLGYPSLDTEAKRLPGADFDGDGMTGLLEFVITGNPTIADRSVLPTLNSSGSNFVFTFRRRDISETNSTLTFRYGTNLTTWTNVVIGEDDGTAPPASYIVQENTTNADLITVTVPKSVAPGGKLFGNLKVTRP